MKTSGDCTLDLEIMFQACYLSWFWKVSKATFKHQLKRYNFYTYLIEDGLCMNVNYELRT
jgi:hypothetical protein